jgi:two-component system response regulator VicR
MKRVLILENDADLLYIMQEALYYEGFHVTCITEVSDIFHLVDTYKPDLLMIDYLLPGTDGGELCKRLKKNSATRHLPVIINSVYPRRQMSLGINDCDDFIAKPFDLDDMVNRIKKLLDKKKRPDIRVI